MICCIIRLHISIETSIPPVAIQQGQHKNIRANNYSTCKGPICAWMVSAQKGQPLKQKDQLDMAQMQSLSPPWGILIT